MSENVAPQTEDLDKKIVKQIEYYFGNINLPRDKFLQEQLKLDGGWVPIPTLLTFNRLASLSKEVEKIAAAVKNASSEIVTVSECNLKIRRHVGNPLPENSLEYWQQIKHRTVYMKGFPLDTQLDSILSWAKQFGEVENVLMRKIKAGDKQFKGSVFVTYKTREEAETAQKSDVKFGEVELTKMMQDDYWVMKNKEVKEQRAAAKAAKQSKKDVESAEKEQAKNTVRYEKGLVLAIEGLGEEASVQTIKDFFNKFGSVGYVAHENGQPAAELRFNNNSEGGATGAWNKAKEAGEDGKIIFQGKELTGRVIEGEEEEKYWTEFNNRKNNRNSQRGGGRGRGRGRGGHRGNREHRDNRAGDKRSAPKEEGAGDAPQAKRTVFEKQDE